MPRPGCPQRAAAMSTSYLDSWFTKHGTTSGGTVDAGHIRVFTYGLGAEYSPTDRWMFSASLPLIESEYHGAFPHATEVDNGHCGRAYEPAPYESQRPRRRFSRTH